MSATEGSPVTADITGNISRGSTNRGIFATEGTPATADLPIASGTSRGLATEGSAAIGDKPGTSWTSKGSRNATVATAGC